MKPGCQCPLCKAQRSTFYARRRHRSRRQNPYRRNIGRKRRAIKKQRRDVAYWDQKRQEARDLNLWGKHLWSRSYYAGSCGGVTLDVIKQYIQGQDRPVSSP